MIEIHLDSPDGPLVGQTEQIVPKDVDFMRAMAANNNNNNKNAGRQGGGGGAAGFDFSLLRRLMSINVKASMQPTSGIHDVYFVFKNPTAKENQTIVAAVEITFQQ